MIVKDSLPIPQQQKFVKQMLLLLVDKEELILALVNQGMIRNFARFDFDLKS